MWTLCHKDKFVFSVLEWSPSTTFVCAQENSFATVFAGTLQCLATQLSSARTPETHSRSPTRTTTTPPTTTAAAIAVGVDERKGRTWLTAARTINQPLSPTQRRTTPTLATAAAVVGVCLGPRHSHLRAPPHKSWCKSAKYSITFHLAHIKSTQNNETLKNRTVFCTRKQIQQ